METETSRIIQNITLDDHVILAVDTDNKELLRFNIKIGDRDFIFKAPTYRQHQHLLVQHAEIIALIANLFPNMLIPDMEMVEKKGLWFDWSKITEKAFYSRVVTKRIEKALFLLLDGSFLNKLKKKIYFRKTATIFDIQKCFTFFCLIDELVKKNCQYMMTTIYKTLEAKPTLLNTFGKSSAGQVPTYIMPQFSESN
jgi:hypothetical protein